MTAKTRIQRSFAIAEGFTREVFATSDRYDLELLIKPDTDLDDRFTAFDLADGEFIRVNGWLFVTEDA